jgi:hypothetical protein
MKTHIADFLKFLESKENKKVPLEAKLLHPNKFTITKEELYVRGHLFVQGTEIQYLPDTFEVGGDVYLGGSLKYLPDNLKVGGDLYLVSTKIESLPDNLTVALNLFLQDTKIESIPNNLKVGENIYIAGTPLAKRLTKGEVKQEIEQKGGFIKLVDKVWRF